MNKIILICSFILLLLLISGCSSYLQESTQYFTDTENKINNMKECNRLMEEHCNDNPLCRGYIIDEIICDEGECYC